MQRNLSFGRWLKERRRVQDLTQEQLARLTGCATETIRKIEAGAVRPSRQIAVRLADILEIPAEERAAFVQLARATPPVEPAPPATAPNGREPINPYKGLRPFLE